MRSKDGKTDTSELEYYEANDEESLKQALEGFDIIISLAGPSADFDVLAKAVISAKPELYIPSQFGMDLDIVPFDVLGFNT